MLFYSRRIGISTTRELTPILGGLPFVGKAGPLNVGALTMETAEAAGEPATNYSVVRVKRDLSDQSYFGFIATNKQSSLSYNRLFAVDGAKFSSPPAISSLTRPAQTWNMGSPQG